MSNKELFVKLTLEQLALLQSCVDALSKTIAEKGPGMSMYIGLVALAPLEGREEAIAFGEFPGWPPAAIKALCETIAANERTRENVSFPIPTGKA